MQICQDNCLTWESLHLILRVRFCTERKKTVNSRSEKTKLTKTQCLIWRCVVLATTPKKTAHTHHEEMPFQASHQRRGVNSGWSRVGEHEITCLVPHQPSQSPNVSIELKVNAQFTGLKASPSSPSSPHLSHELTGWFWWSTGNQTNKQHHSLEPKWLEPRWLPLKMTMMMIQNSPCTPPCTRRLSAPQLHAQLSRLSDRTWPRRLENTLHSKDAWQHVTKIGDLCAGSVLVPHDYITNVQKRLGNRAWTGFGQCRLCGSFLDPPTWTRRNLQHRRSHSGNATHARLSRLETCGPRHHHRTQRTHRNAIQVVWSLSCRCPRTQRGTGCVCGLLQRSSSSRRRCASTLWS